MNIKNVTGSGILEGNRPKILGTEATQKANKIIASTREKLFDSFVTNVE